MLTWFDTYEVDAFASSLASDFCQRVPPNTITDNIRGSKNRLADARGIVMDRVSNFVATRRLNFYKRASLANKFKWALLENGYPNALVDTLVLEVVKRAVSKRG